MARTVMGTVDKAMSLLGRFSVQSPELGSRALARLGGFDKTTTLRCMTALERHGFVEQDGVSRKYRLGLAPIYLARIRENSFPVQQVLKRYLDALQIETGETAHATLVSGHILTNSMVSEPERALRVHVEPASFMPLHATATGVAIAAFSTPDIFDEMTKASTFEAFTAQTPTTPEALRIHVQRARQTGLVRSLEWLERDVIGTAAALWALGLAGGRDCSCGCGPTL